ncbi:MAG: hypothetical protein PUF48_05205 [Oscillospiraceae bacterium]|nr:hypothetical protein [Oscillospiraceae bacterium]
MGFEQFLPSGKKVRRSSCKGTIAFADCVVSSNADFSQPLGAVEKSRGAEYPVKDKATK